ncbi:MAG: polyhydroxyalkanoate depolymerase [Candidatus Nanopelagicales bacterium]
MLYAGYEISRWAAQPALSTSGAVARTLRGLPGSIRSKPLVRHAWAATEVMSGLRATHDRPAFGIDSVRVDAQQYAVTERETSFSPFATRIHFRKSVELDQPRVLVVGPLSGHFATLVRPTVRSLLSDFDVHVLTWNNARDVPAGMGGFDLEDYIAHVMLEIRGLGPDTHVLAVCQPAVPVLAAVSLLAQQDDAAQPRSLTLIAGPIDTRINPNRVNEFAMDKPLDYFQKYLIHTVPGSFPGAGRRVYPGFLQLSAFMSMNAKRHVSRHVDMYRALASGDTEGAQSVRTFYDEYGAIMDVYAEFYLDTVDQVFQRHLLPQGQMSWRGEPVDPRAIRRTALLTVEGEQDDICSPGQNRAAHDLCSSLPGRMRGHHLAPGVGHYGVFSGSRWQAEIYPVVRGFINTHSTVAVP